MNIDPNPCNRRQFLKETSIAAAMAMMGGVALQAQPAASNTSSELTPIPIGPSVKYGVVGLGAWGREIIGELNKLPNAPVTAICDTYSKSLNRGATLAPNAEKFDDYNKLIDSKEVQAVVVATPTHLHKDIVLAALKAGKHVYCEAPLAHTLEDARAIAAAAKASVKSVFQAGLQGRSHPHRQYVIPFLLEGNAGEPICARAQSHQKKSWVQISPDQNRQDELNWRLNQKVSTGLLGEIGVHQIDTISWFNRARPTAVSGFGSVIRWKEDGRTVPDTVQATIEYARGFNLTYIATLGNAFDSNYEVYHGAWATLLMQGTRGWMFKEVDSPNYGWEVYAKKETVFGEEGIVVRAGASKQDALAKNPVNKDPFPNSGLYYALADFTLNVGMVTAAIEDYANTYDANDLAGLAANLATLKKAPVPGWKEGLESTIVAIKANEAIMKKERIVLTDEMFSV